MKLIHQAKIVNEGQIFKGSVLIENDKIKKIFKEKLKTDYQTRITKT